LLRSFFFYSLGFGALGRDYIYFTFFSFYSSSGFSSIFSYSFRSIPFEKRENRFGHENFPDLMAS
jgi:hypothetical protein